MAVLERQLDDKVCEVTEQVSHVTELEEEVAVKTMRLAKLRNDLEEKTRELVSGQSAVDKVKALHTEQCAELEKHIEIVSTLLVFTVTPRDTFKNTKRSYMEKVSRCIDNLHSWNSAGKKRKSTWKLFRKP